MSNMHLFLTGALAIIVLIGALRFKALRHLKDRQNKLQRKEELKQKQDSELRERATKFESIAASMVKDIVEGNSPLPSVKTTSRKEPLKNRILPDNRTEMRVFLNDIARDAIYFPRVFPPVHPMTS